MKKFFTPLFLATALLAGCSKTTPEPEPAEQVIGIYNVDKLTESVKFVGTPTENSQTLNLPFKGANGYELSAVIDLSKKSSNTLTAVYTETEIINGKKVPDITPLNSIELKKADNAPAGQFDMYDGVDKIGTVGNGSITIEDITTGKDSLGRQFTYTFRISGKKAN
jgi:hypothetical protein